MQLVKEKKNIYIYVFTYIFCDILTWHNLKKIKFLLQSEQMHTSVRNNQSEPVLSIILVDTLLIPSPLQSSGSCAWPPKMADKRFFCSGELFLCFSFVNLTACSQAWLTASSWPSSWLRFVVSDQITCLIFYCHNMVTVLRNMLKKTTFFL